MVLQMTNKFSTLPPVGIDRDRRGAAGRRRRRRARTSMSSSSTVASVIVGTHLAMGDKLSIPSGGQIRAVLPTGKTQTIRGPFEGKVSDLAKGAQNEGVWSWMKNMLKTGGSTEITTGATRSVSREAASRGRSRGRRCRPRSTASICVQKGAKVLADAHRDGAHRSRHAGRCGERRAGRGGVGGGQPDDRLAGQPEAARMAPTRSSSRTGRSAMSPCASSTSCRTRTTCWRNCRSAAASTSSTPGCATRSRRRRASRRGSRS